MPVISKVRQRVEIRPEMSMTSEKSLGNNVIMNVSEEDDDVMSKWQLFSITHDAFLVKHRCFLPQMEWNEIVLLFETTFQMNVKVHHVQTRMDLLTASETSIAGLLELYLEDLLEKNPKLQIHPHYIPIITKNKNIDYHYITTSPNALLAEDIDVELTCIGRHFPQVILGY